MRDFAGIVAQFPGSVNPLPNVVELILHEFYFLKEFEVRGRVRNGPLSSPFRTNSQTIIN